MSYVDFTVRMKRKPDYWIAFVLLPSIFLVALSYENGTVTQLLRHQRDPLAIQQLTFAHVIEGR